MSEANTPNETAESGVSQLQAVVRPTFSEWLKEMRIHMTAKETIHAMHAAQRRGQTLEKFLGYPWA